MIPLTQDQMDDIITDIMKDKTTWNHILAVEAEVERNLFLAREQGKEIDDSTVVLPTPIKPDIYEIVTNILANKFEDSENLYIGLLIVQIRIKAREILGLQN